MRRRLLFTGCSMLLAWGLSVFAQPQPGTPLWSFTAQGSVTGCPGLAPDGTLYLGTSAGLCAITNAGSNKWAFAANVGASPAIAADGTIYYATAYSQLIAFTPAGALKLPFPNDYNAGAGQCLSPVIGADGTIFLGAYGSGAFAGAMNPDGPWKWNFPLDASASDSAAIAAD